MVTNRVLMIQNNTLISKAHLPQNLEQNYDLPASKPYKINTIATKIFMALTPPAWLAAAATTGLKFTATPFAVGAVVITVLAFVSRLFERFFPAPIPKTTVDFSQVHRTLLKAFFEAENFEQTKERLLPLKLFGKNDDIAKFYTEREIELINLKLLSLFLQPDGPTEIDELTECSPYMALMADETADWIYDCIHHRPIFQQHVDMLELRKEVTAESVNAEISFIDEHSRVIYYEYHKNSKAWRHYFFEIAQMLKQAPQDQRDALGDAFYAAIAPTEAVRESFSSYLERFHKDGDASYVLNETLRLPAPHGQIALNIAVASGLIDLSQPPEQPLFHELAGKRIKPEVINRLIETMSYHQVDLNCRNKEGNTLLHIAVMNQNLPLVVALVLKGTKLEIMNDEQETALYLARDRAANSNQPNAAIIYQTLLLGFTQTLALQRLMPLNILPTQVGGTPLASKINKAKGIKHLAHARKVFGDKVINAQALKSLGDGLGIVANVLKVGESEQAHNDAITTLNQELQEVQVQLKNSLVIPEGKQAFRRRQVELEAKINELNEEKQRAEKNIYLNAGQNGVGLVQNVLKWAPTPSKALSHALPILDIASNAISLWQNFESADENCIKKAKDEQLLKLVETECHSFGNLMSSFEESQFVYRLLNLKLMELIVQKRFLENRIKKYETANIDAGIEGRAAGVQLGAVVAAVAIPAAAPLMLIAGTVAGQASPIRTGIRMFMDWYYPVKLPDISNYEPRQFECFDEVFEQRCADRLGMEVSALNDEIISMISAMKPEDEEWFLAMINQAGIPCTREQFADDKPFYILSYLVD